MPLEHALWRIDMGLNHLPSAVLDNESLIEECIIDLKKDLTPRDVVAQTIDYAAWIQSLSSDVIAGIFVRDTTTYKPELKQKTLDDAFKDRFGIELAAEDLNGNYQIGVKAPNFQSQRLEHLALNILQTMRQDISLNG